MKVAFRLYLLAIYDKFKRYPREVDRILTNLPATAEAQALLATPFPSEFVPGARSAVETCLRIQPSEKVTLITDQATAPIAASLAQELVANGCRWNAFVLEDLALRPLVDMPPPVLADMETSDVSIFAVGVQRNELRSRMQMTEVVNRRRMRHAHMVNITPQIMCEGMRADFARVDQLSQKVIEKVRRASYIRATTAAGTDIRAELNPGLQVAQDIGHHLARQVGQSSRRRNLHHSGRSERHLCRRRRGRRLSLCALRTA